MGIFPVKLPFTVYFSNFLNIRFQIRNVNRMQRSYKLIQYLPLPGADYLINNPLSDLHLIMELVNQNDQARNVS